MALLSACAGCTGPLAVVRQLHHRGWTVAQRSGVSRQDTAWSWARCAVGGLPGVKLWIERPQELAGRGLGLGWSHVTAAQGQWRKAICNVCKNGVLPERCGVKVEEQVQHRLGKGEATDGSEGLRKFGRALGSRSRSESSCDLCQRKMVRYCCRGSSMSTWIFDILVPVECSIT